MRIAIVTESFLPRTDAWSAPLLELLSFLRTHHHQALVFAPGQGPAEHLGFEIVRIGGFRLPPIPRPHAGAVLPAHGQAVARLETGCRAPGQPIRARRLRVQGRSKAAAAVAAHLSNRRGRLCPPFSFGGPLTSGNPRTSRVCTTIAKRTTHRPKASGSPDRPGRAPTCAYLAAAST